MKLDRSRFWERKEELIVGSVIVLDVDLLNSQWDEIFDSAYDVLYEKEVEVNVRQWFDNGRKKKKMIWRKEGDVFCQTRRIFVDLEQ